jgi:hypothetical protein
VFFDEVETRLKPMLSPVERTPPPPVTDAPAAALPG